MKSKYLTVKLSPQRRPFTDVVGLEVGAGFAEGVPAVRLRKRDGRIEVLAAGFLDLPDAFPQSQDEAAGRTPQSWQLPHVFRAPYAALAVTSKLSFLRHSAGVLDDAPEKKQFAYRQVSRVIAPDLPPFTAGLPEFQAAWAARLLPEGHKPTACSLQLAASAAMSGFIASPAFADAAGSAVTLFVFSEYTALAAFQETRLVLYREHPIGYSQIRTAISTQMGIDHALADAVMDDTLIDPASIIEPVLRPLFRQVEISADYLLRRRNCPVKHFFVCGLPAGTRYWSTVFSHMMNLPLTACPALDGIEKAPRPAALADDLVKSGAPLLLAAAGAARAALEDVV